MADFIQCRNISQYDNEISRQTERFLRKNQQIGFDAGKFCSLTDDNGRLELEYYGLITQQKY